VGYLTNEKVRHNTIGSIKAWKCNSDCYENAVEVKRSVH